MSEISVTFRHAEFTAPIANSKRSKLGKREMTGGIPMSFEDIPPDMVWEMAVQAMTAFVQADLKNLDQENCTREDCIKSMQRRYEMLKAGVVTAPGAARKAPTRDPVKAEAKKILKAAIQKRSKEKIDGRALTSAASKLFKQHAEWQKTKAPELEPIAKLVEGALASARARFEETDGLSKGLDAVVAAAKAEAASKATKATPAAKPKAKAATGKATGRSA